MRPLEELRLDINRDFEVGLLGELDGFRQQEVTKSDQHRGWHELRDEVGVGSADRFGVGRFARSFVTLVNTLLMVILVTLAMMMTVFVMVTLVVMVVEEIVAKPGMHQ